MRAILAIPEIMVRENGYVNELSDVSPEFPPGYPRAETKKRIMLLSFARTVKEFIDFAEKNLYRSS